MDIGLNLTKIVPSAREWIFADPRRQAQVTLPPTPVPLPGGPRPTSPPARYSARGLAWEEPHRFEPAARNGIWAKDFTARLAPFKTLRFLDWQRTNSSPLRSWSDRRLPTDLTQADWGTTIPTKGVSYELIIDLCNLLKADPWIHVPHLADDDYVARMANLFVQRLTPDRTLYLEFSNELWNAGPGFSQGDWVNENTWHAVPRVPYRTFVAAQLRRVFALWKAAFTSPYAPKLVRVVAGQAANPSLAHDLCAELMGGFEAVSCAAYFDPRGPGNQWPPYDATTTPAQILADCQTHLRTRTLPAIQRHQAIAAQYHVPLLIYEGGQQCTASGRSVIYQRAMEAAQDQTGMGDLYRELLDGAAAAGASLFLHYNSTGGRDANGMWGLWETQEQQRSTKADAVRDWQRANP